MDLEWNMSRSKTIISEWVEYCSFTLDVYVSWSKVSFSMSGKGSVQKNQFQHARLTVNGYSQINFSHGRKVPCSEKYLSA
jgi:hypothetical protein